MHLDNTARDSLGSAISAIGCFYQRLDSRDYAGVAASFVADGVWHRQGSRLIGHQAILDAMQGRSATLIIHHLATNIALEMAGPDRLKATYYLTVFKFDSGKPLPGPAPAAAPTMIAVCDAELRLTTEGWKFETLATRTATFEGRIEGQSGR